MIRAAILLSVPAFEIWGLSLAAPFAGGTA